MKRRRRPTPAPHVEPSTTVAAWHRVLAHATGMARDPFAGCTFPACSCADRCRIFDADTSEVEQYIADGITPGG